jgi:hypothetical protein
MHDKACVLFSVQLACASCNDCSLTSEVHICEGLITLQPMTQLLMNLTFDRSEQFAPRKQCKMRQPKAAILQLAWPQRLGDDMPPAVPLMRWLMC